MFKLNPDRIYIFDGAMGTLLQANGLQLRQIPEALCFTNPELVCRIHSDYRRAGADFITANTFGANRYKLARSGLSVRDVVRTALSLARSSAGNAFVALDIGPTGRVMAPLGDASFSDIYDAVAEIVRAGNDLCDVILLETFTDLYELKIAALAALENSSLPVFATMSFEASGKSFFGNSADAMVFTLQDMGLAAIGLNCSLGPVQLMPLARSVCALSHIPVIVQPNAGLPAAMLDGASHYDLSPSDFASSGRDFAAMGVQIIGGCCGTTPTHIESLKNALRHNKAVRRNVADRTVICSGAKTVEFGDRFVVIGERLNPTGRRGLQRALRGGDMGYVVREAVAQEEGGADVVDINVGLPDINEPEVLVKALMAIQGVTEMPVQLDSSSASALEAGAGSAVGSQKKEGKAPLTEIVGEFTHASS